MHRTLSLITLLAALGLSACGPTTYTMQGLQPFLGADGVVEVRDEQGAHEVRVEVTNLVPPDRVGTGLAQYVLWIAPVGGAAVRAATLVYDPGDREGSARATFPDAQFVVTVTAEAAGAPSVPSTNVVFSQTVDAR